MDPITEKLSLVFTDKQIQAMKDAWNFGAWGDAEVNFQGVDEFGLGACTNDIKNGNHFNGRQIAGIMSGISKRINKSKTNLVACFHDWWGDGSGDMIFFNYHEFGLDNSTDGWSLLTEWSKSND